MTTFDYIFLESGRDLRARFAFEHEESSTLNVLTSAPSRKSDCHPRGFMTRRYSLTLDLQEDPRLIAEYKRYHEKVWPEIIQSLKDVGVEGMEIYVLGTRMFMIMEVNESFSFEAKARDDQANPKVQEWERIMSGFQQPLPCARSGERWMLMERVFQLEA